MNFRTTIVLLLLVIVAGWYLFVYEKDKPATEVSTKLGSEQVLLEDFDADAVNHITIERDGQTIVMEKDGADWMQTRPVRFGVSSFSGNQFGTTAGDLKTTETAEGDADAFGLNPPKAVLTLKGDGETTTFKLGRKLTIGARGYLMLDDDPKVYVVSDELHNLVLDGDVKEWRNKSLTGVKEGQANRVVLSRGDDTIELIKSDGAWAFGGSHSGRVATKSVEDLLGKLDNMYVREFAVDQPDDLSVYGLTSPRTSLLIEPAAATTQPASSQPAAKATTLSIGAPTDLKEEKFYAALTHGDQPADVVFVIAKSDKEKFDTKPDDLRDKRISLVNAEDVNTIELKRGDGSLKLERSDAGWTFADPAPAFGPDGGVISELLEAIEVAEAESFVANAKPQAAALVTSTLTATGRAEPDVLKIFPHDDENHLLLRNNESTGYVLPARKLALLTQPAIAWRHRTVVDVKADDLKKLTVTRPDGLSLAFEKSETWQLSGHDKFESADLEALLIYFQPLMAEKWLASGTVGDNAYHLQVGDTKVSIDADTRVATAGGVDGVFEVSQGMLDALGVEFRHRTVFDFTVDDIKEVTVDSAAVNKDEASGLFDALAGLRVERFVQSPGEGEVSRTVQITLKDGGRHTLRLTPPNRGAIGDKHFDLSSDDFEKLTAEIKK